MSQTFEIISRAIIRISGLIMICLGLRAIFKFRSNNLRGRSTVISVGRRGHNFEVRTLRWARVSHTSRFIKLGSGILKESPYGRNTYGHISRNIARLFPRPDIFQFNVNVLKNYSRLSRSSCCLYFCVPLYPLNVVS
jgi:hypothetical protein